MAKRRRPKKRESPPEPTAADTPLPPGAEEEAEKKKEEEEEAAEGGGGGRPFRVPPEPAAQDEEAGAAPQGGGGGRGGDVSSRAEHGQRRRDPGGRGRRGGGGGGGCSRSHSHGFPASRLRPPRRRCRTACWERGAVRAPAEPGERGGAGCRGRSRAGAASESLSRAPGSGSPLLPADRAKVPVPPRGIMGEGNLRHPPPQNAQLPKHSPESTGPPRAGQSGVNRRPIKHPGCPRVRGRARALTSGRALRAHVGLVSPPHSVKSKNKKRGWMATYPAPSLNVPMECFHRDHLFTL